MPPLLPHITLVEPRRDGLAAVIDVCESEADLLSRAGSGLFGDSDGGVENTFQFCEVSSPPKKRRSTQSIACTRSSPEHARASAGAQGSASGSTLVDEIMVMSCTLDD